MKIQIYSLILSLVLLISLSVAFPSTGSTNILPILKEFVMGYLV